MSRQPGSLLFNHTCDCKLVPQYSVIVSCTVVNEIMEALSHLVCDHFDISEAPSNSTTGRQDDGSVIYGVASIQQYAGIDDESVEYTCKLRHEYGDAPFIRISLKAP